MSRRACTVHISRPPTGIKRNESHEFTAWRLERMKETSFSEATQGCFLVGWSPCVPLRGDLWERKSISDSLQGRKELNFDSSISPPNWPHVLEISLSHAQSSLEMLINDFDACRIDIKLVMRVVETQQQTVLLTIW